MPPLCQKSDRKVARKKLESSAEEDSWGGDGSKEVVVQKPEKKTCKNKK